MNWKMVQSTSRPQDQDITSSKTVNYVRRNIHTVQVTDIQGGQEEIRTIYEYEEATIAKEMWSMYQQMEQQQADIDFLTMLTEDL